MHILFYKDLIINFLSRNIKNDTHNKLIKKLLENENSKFLYSKKFLLKIKEELGNDYEEEFVNLTTKLIDSGENIQSSETSSDFDEEIIHLYQNIKKSVVVSIAHIEPAELVLKTIKNIAILSEYQKPNYHWLVIELAILHPNKVSVNCFDFKEDSEIKEFFTDIFKIPRFITRINILDRQTQEFNHNRFDCFKDSYTVYYYTFFHRCYFQDEPYIRAFFPKLKIFTTRNKNITHSRKIVFESIVVISDNDFNNLAIAGDWEISVQYSDLDARQWLARCNPSNYKESIKSSRKF